MSAGERAESLQAQVNKRLTLNWLIQGAAVHSARTVHHLVRDELAALSPKLQPLYDQFAVALHLQHWRGEMALWTFVGRVFRRLLFLPRDPIPGHRLLCEYRDDLSRAAKRRVLDRAKEKGVVRLPGAFSFYVVALVARLNRAERNHREALAPLARQAAAQVFGIHVDRLLGEIVEQGRLDRRGFGPLDSPQSVYLQIGMVSWNKVVFMEGVGCVQAQAINGYLLMAEFIKGIAELICLRGLSELDDATYAHVIRAADKVKYEPVMIETGGELWRRLLAALPAGTSTARLLMNLALLTPSDLEALVESIILEKPGTREALAQLCADETDDDVAMSDQTEDD